MRRVVASLAVLLTFSGVASAQFAPITLLQTSAPVVTAGSIHCWGIGDYRLGTEDAGDGSPDPVPTPQYLGITNDFRTTAWKSLSAGNSHTCAIRASDDRLFCWGAGTSGKLGNGGTANIATPTALGGGFDTAAWESVSAGGNHSCAIRASDGILYCWGRSLYGPLGNGVLTDASYTTPVSLAGGYSTTAWKKVSAGDMATCAIRASDDRLFCWGWAGSGMLGNGTTTPNTSSPGPLAATGGWDAMAWKDVAVGYNRTCAIRSDDRIFCWGREEYGALGNGGVASTSYSTPQALNSTGGWDTMSWKMLSQGIAGKIGGISKQTTCAIRSDDELFCWGSADGASLGNGATTGTYPTPTALAGGFDTSTWKSVSVSYGHTCAVRLTDSRLFCWGGDNESGALGNGATTGVYSTPTALTSSGGWDAKQWLSVATGYYDNTGNGTGFACAIATGVPPPLPKGYFVYVNGLGNGNLGGMSGANALCHTRLNAGTWLGKASSSVADSAKVKAFLCDNSTCNNLLANTAYYFASVANDTYGGSGFLTDASGIGPGNTTAWSGTTYFGGNVDYFTGRSQGTSALWATTADSNTCSNWTSTSSSFSVKKGISTGSGFSAYYRWSQTSSSCNSFSTGAICFVNP